MQGAPPGAGVTGSRGLQRVGRSRSSRPRGFGLRPAVRAKALTTFPRSLSLPTNGRCVFTDIGYTVFTDTENDDMKLTNSELMREIERTRHLLSNLEAERDRRQSVIEDNAQEGVQFAARNAINDARLVLSRANDALGEAEGAGNRAEVERIERDVLPGLRARLEAALEAGREVLL